MYPLIDTVRIYIKYLKDQLAGRSRAKEELDHLKASEQEMKNREREVRLELQRGRVHPTEAVEAVMNDMLGAFRTRLRNLPQALSQKAGLSNEQQDTILDEINAICEVMSNYNAEEFYERNPQFLSEAVLSDEKTA